jgi:hypothetical protein
VLGGLLIGLLAYAQYQVIHSAREQSSRNNTIRIAASLCWYSRLPEISDGTAIAPTRSAG